MSPVRARPDVAEARPKGAFTQNRHTDRQTVWHVERMTRRLPCRVVASDTELWKSEPGRRAKIDTRAGRDDAGRMDGSVAAAIMCLDMVEMYGLGHARYLVRRARIVP